MTPKDAIKILEDELAHTRHHLMENGKDPEYYEELGQFAEAVEKGIIALTADWPLWRSTETDPPKTGEPVLIARKIRHNETVLVEPAVLRPDGNWKAIGHKIKSSSVRYWMPMPEPPKESEI